MKKKTNPELPLKYVVLVMADERHRNGTKSQCGFCFPTLKTAKEFMAYADKQGFQAILGRPAKKKVKVKK